MSANFDEVLPAPGSPAMDVPVEVVPALAYQAKPDPSDPQKKLAISGAQVTLPVSADAFGLAVKRVDLPDTSEEVFECRAELSLDGGVTWSPDPDGRKQWPWGEFPISFRARGGETIIDGVPVNESGVVRSLPDKANQNRVIRTFFTPLKDLTASVSLITGKVV